MPEQSPQSLQARIFLSPPIVKRFQLYWGSNAVQATCSDPFGHTDVKMGKAQMGQKKEQEVSNIFISLFLATLIPAC